MSKHNTMNHAEVVKLSMTLSQDREKIAAAFNKGSTMLDMAAKYKCPIGSFKTIAAAVGIELPNRQASRPQSNLVVADLLTVVVRIADQLEVNRSELNKYLEPQS